MITPPNDILTGRHLHLRAMEPEDANLLYAWENDTTVWQVSNTVVPFSRFTIRDYVETASRDIFAARQLRLMIEEIPEKGLPQTIGAADLFNFEPIHLRAGIGILVIAPHRRKGYAAEALSILIRYAFEVLLLHQLYCETGADNEAAIRLFTNAGFTHCGTRKEWNNTGTSWQDEWMFQLINRLP
jgi:diamine N-acetyltransferase